MCGALACTSIILPSLSILKPIKILFFPADKPKPFTILAALESSKYKPETIIDTNPGFIKVGRKILQDHHNNGPISVSDIIINLAKLALPKLP